MTDIRVDKYSQSVCLLEQLVNGKRIAHASAFLWRRSDAHYLITNWHVLSGRSTHTGQPLADHGGCPDSVECKVQVIKTNGRSAIRPFNAPTIDESGRSLWLQHPELGQDVDVAAMKIADEFDPERLVALNDIEQTDDMGIDVGQELFVLGYPLDPQITGPLPIWKRGSVASELSLPIRGRPCFLVDTATRDGMSGAPVIAVSWGSYHTTKGRHNISSGRFARFLGVYSGRLGADRIGEVQLGVVWWRDVIDEICDQGVPGEHQLRS